MHLALGIIDPDLKASIRLLFDNSNDTSKQTPEASDHTDYAQKNYPCVEILTNEYYFFKADDKKWTMALVVPEDSSGKELAQAMIRETEVVTKNSGFHPAANLLKKTLMLLMDGEVYWEAKAALMYITRDKEKLEIVSTGKLWAGLYRMGRLNNETKNSQDDHDINNGPEGLMSKLIQVHGFQFENLEEVWYVESGDYLLLAWADLQYQLKDLIEIAVDSAEVNGTPICQVTHNLKPFFNFFQTRNNVLVGMELTI